MARFETFVVEVYVMADTVQARSLPPHPGRRGRTPALSRSEVLTLALLSQRQRFSREREFMRVAATCLRARFPTLPDRSQVNRAIRRPQPVREAVGQWCAEQVGRAAAPYDLRASTAAPRRNPQRRGDGARPELTAVGKRLRRGFVHGVRVRVATTPAGAMTGTSIAPGTTNDHPHADVFFAVRAAADPPAAVGTSCSGPYLAATGFAGRRWRAHWAADRGAPVEAPPHPDRADAWPQATKPAHIRARQLIASVFGRLLDEFRRERERPKTIGGLLTRLAAKVGLHNFLRWRNRQEGRGLFVIAGVIGW